VVDDTTAPVARVEYDLSAVSARSAPWVRRRRNVGVVGLVVMVGFLALVLLGGWNASLHHKFDGVILIDFIIGIVGGSSIIAMLAVGVRRLRTGAMRLRLSSDSFALSYPDGKVAVGTWSDPRLRLRLIDLSQVDPSRLLSGVTHLISYGGVRSSLTPEAFRAVLGQAARRQLTDQVSGGWRTPVVPPNSPIYHDIRAIRP
jgi:hypothetical protein